ncbi:response regulator [Afifella sp. IM 167]|uniref:response regulator n=1 Tax=Afifella sp. IM 167 TaxID=2033586 RepID=UPI001CCC6C20|nr:response regulator [Afifella sp. IM 167]MBZ8135235.1 hypothetical protein [Afifella sp. IM 167]
MKDAHSILVAEDEGLLALELQLALKEAGYRVIGPFERVVEGLDALGSEAPDAALLDVKLRDGEVFPLARRLHEKGVPITFFSGRASEDRLWPRRLRGLPRMNKPLSPQVLAGAVAAMTARIPQRAGI